MNKNNNGDSLTNFDYEEVKVYNQDDSLMKSYPDEEFKPKPQDSKIHSQKEIDNNNGKRDLENMHIDKKIPESLRKLILLDKHLENNHEELIPKNFQNSIANKNTENNQHIHLVANGRDEVHADAASPKINRNETSEGTFNGDSLNFSDKNTEISTEEMSPNKSNIEKQLIVNDKHATSIDSKESPTLDKDTVIYDKFTSGQIAKETDASEETLEKQKSTGKTFGKLLNNDASFSSEVPNIHNIDNDDNDLSEVDNSSASKEMEKDNLINDSSFEMSRIIQSENTSHENNNDSQEGKLDQKKTEVKLTNNLEVMENENDPLSNIPLINQEIIQNVINNEIKNTRERISLAESINNAHPKYLQNSDNIDTSLLEQHGNVVPSSNTEYENQIDTILNGNGDDNLELPEKIAIKKRESTSDILAESHRILEKVKNLKDSNFSSKFMALREEQAQISALPMILVAPRTLPMEVQIGINSLPNLDNLASQVLRFFVLSSFDEIKTILEDPDSEESLALNVLVHLFTTAKSLYTRDIKNFITIEDITPGITNSLHDYELTIVGREEIFDSTIKKTNLATFICAVTSLIDINLIELNESFMDVFTSGYLSSDFNSGISLISSITGIGMPGKLTRLLGDLFLELKTQAYIANCTTKNADNDGESDAPQDRDNGQYDEELEYLFPNNLQEILTESAELKVSVPAEKEFVQKCASRKLYLKDTKTLDELLEKYPFIDFVKGFLKFISRNIGFTIYGKRISQGGNRLTLWNNHNESGFGSYTTDPQALKRSQDEMAKDLYSKKKQKVFNPGASDRRLWTTEELDCLISSIKEYGAQWTKILQIHGNGGAKSEILKNRSTTQLKDKARNIKIQFLKNDQQLPDYLQKVPGELEKSGPRARRKN